jgi:hypothetical protein
VLDRVEPLVQALDGVARLDGDRLLGDDRAGVHALVDEVDGHTGFLCARLEGLADGVEPGKRGQERRMHVDARESVEEAAAEELHVARADHQLHAVLVEPVGHRLVALVAVGIVLLGKDRCSDRGALGALERLDSGSVRRDCADGEPRVQEGL